MWGLSVKVVDVKSVCKSGGVKVVGVKSVLRHGSIVDQKIWDVN